MTRRRPWTRSASNRSGSALIEFALVAPLLVTLMLGIADLGPTLMAKFKVASATQTVADLATQSATVQTSDVANFLGAGADVMAPFSGSPLVLRITNVASDGNGRAFIYWSCGQGSLPPYSATSTVASTPNGVDLRALLLLDQRRSGNYVLNGADTSYIMVESRYVYTAPAGLIFRSAQTFTTVAYAMPRVSTYIGPTTGSASYTHPAPTAVRSQFTTSSDTITCNIGY